MSVYVPDPAYETNTTLLRIVEMVQEALWLQPDGTWDPDKEWDSDIINEVADALIYEGLRPAKILEAH